MTNLFLYLSIVFLLDGSSLFASDSNLSEKLLMPKNERNLWWERHKKMKEVKTFCNNCSFKMHIRREHQKAGGGEE